MFVSVLTQTKTTIGWRRGSSSYGNSWQRDRALQEVPSLCRCWFHRPKQKYENIARKNGASLLFAKSGSQEETWVALIEKAYAKFYGNYAHLEGGWTREAIEDLTGCVR